MTPSAYFELLLNYHGLLIFTDHSSSRIHSCCYSTHHVSYETLYLIKSELCRGLNSNLGKVCYSINSLIKCFKYNQMYTI